MKMWGLRPLRRTLYDFTGVDYPRWFPAIRFLEVFSNQKWAWWLGFPFARDLRTALHLTESFVPGSWSKVASHKCYVSGRKCTHLFF